MMHPAPGKTKLLAHARSRVYAPPPQPIEPCQRDLESTFDRFKYSQKIRNTLSNFKIDGRTVPSSAPLIPSDQIERLPPADLDGDNDRQAQWRAQRLQPVDPQ